MSWSKTNSLKSFEQLFRTQYASLFSLGYSISQQPELTKDVIQSVFLIVWEKRAQLDKIEHLPAYLRKIMAREMIHHLKANQQRTKRHQQKTCPDLPASPEAILIQEEQRLLDEKRLHYAIAQLPEQQRAMLLLRFQEGLSYDEIAEKSGKSKQTVYNQIYQAIKSLKEVLLLGLAILLNS